MPADDSGGRSPFSPSRGQHREQVAQMRIRLIRTDRPLTFWPATDGRQVLWHGGDRQFTCVWGRHAGEFTGSQLSRTSGYRPNYQLYASCRLPWIRRTDAPTRAGGGKRLHRRGSTALPMHNRCLDRPSPISMYWALNEIRPATRFYHRRRLQQNSPTNHHPRRSRGPRLYQRLACTNELSCQSDPLTRAGCHLCERCKAKFSSATMWPSKRSTSYADPQLAPVTANAFPWS